jgi:hypothetical protein
VWTTLAAPRTPAPWAELPVAELAPEYVRRVVRDGISPGPLSHLSDDALLLAVSASAAVMLVLMVAAAAARLRPATNAVIGVVLIAASPAAFVLNVWVNHVIANRYAAVPVAFLVAGLLVLAAGVPFVGRWLFLVAGAGAVTLGMLSFATHPQRGAGPDFPNEVRRAAPRCEDALPHDWVRVPISPAAAPGGLQRWYTELPCDRLLDGPADPSFP